MPNLLGLYIDVNNIGWSLLDSNTLKIIDMGVRVFPVGCENYGSGKRELSKRAYKRTKRTARHRHQRNKIRKIKVLELLLENGLCPLDKKSLKQWKNEKIYPKEALLEWLRMNPYHLRKKAVMKPITPFEMGRIIYQISIHRGFPVSERNRGVKENVMYTGLPEKNKPGINQTQSQIKNSTLGIYLNSLLPEEKESYKYTNDRVRNRFLTREMFQSELEGLWDYQSQFIKELTPALKLSLIGDMDQLPPVRGTVFYQRPLKSQKFRVGRCPYEPKKTKCCISSLHYQEVLAYRWANSLKVNGSLLSEEDNHKAVRFFMTNKRFPFGKLKGIFSNPNGHYNLKDDEVIKGSFINATLSHPSLFGNSWFNFNPSKKEEIWHSLYFFDNEQKLKTHVMEKWGLNEIQANKFCSIQLDKNYAPISKKAASNLLFFLKKGISYNLSIILGGIKNCLGKQWDEIAEADIQFLINRLIGLYKEHKITGFVPKLKAFLEEHLEPKNLRFDKLYGITTSLEKKKVLNQFPIDKNSDRDIYQFKNPLLITAVFQLRKLVNEIIEKFGVLDEVKGELSAQIKLNKYQRQLLRLDTNRRARLKEKYVKLLGERAENIIPLNLIKFELWEECKNTCPYTGAHIPLNELFTDAVQVVYIHPWYHSMNDSHWNKTLCVKSFSNNILDSSPYDYFQNHEPEKWELVIKRAARLFSNTKDFPSSYRKFKRFIKKHNFRNPLVQQMHDSNVLSREVKEFLSKVAPQVSIAPGQASIHFIEKWRLGQIVASENIKISQENDFRYSAILAYVNANRSEEYLKILSNENKYISSQKKIVFPNPYKGFRDDIEYYIHSILVSHKKVKNIVSSRMQKSKKGDQHFNNFCVSVRGSLHKESVFGKRITPQDQLEAFHLRKPLNAITTLKQVDKIVDSNVRLAVMEAVARSGGFQGERIPGIAFFGSDHQGFTTPKVFLPNKKGDPVPVKKVRIRESLTGVVQLKEGINQYVNLRNNHHVLVYLNQEQEYCEEVVSFWEVIRRNRFNEPLYQLPVEGSQFITSMKINDLYLLGLEEKNLRLEEESKSFLAKHLYRIQKLSSKFYEFRRVYDKNLKETESENYIRINNFGNRKTGWHTFNPIKVKINTIGTLELENELDYFLKMQRHYV